MEWGWESWGWQKHPLEDELPDLVEEYPQLKYLLDFMDDRELLPDWKSLKNAYDHFFHQQLPNWILELDPDTPYWPSSPSSNTPFCEANGQRMGDAHYWDVWHGRKPFTAYRESYPRFMSEFGFQAFPTIETIHFYTQPEDRNLTSYIMEHHQRGNHGNGLMIAQMTDTFQMPDDFYSWIYLSNVLQAEGIRYGVEHWRRNMHRVSGTLYWQLNDCWPVASWSSIDYFGRWKALHYAAKRFYAPLLLSIEDKPPVMDVHLTSDLTTAASCNITWSLETIAGVKIENGEIKITAKPLANSLVHSFDFGNAVHVDNQREVVFVCELWKDGILLATNIGTFVPNKHLSLQDPELIVSVKEQDEIFEIKCSTSQLARFVELKLKGYEVEFSDNYFDIPAGRTRTVVCKKPEGLSLAMTDKCLQTYTLYDSFNSPST
jgi:beta-mannosidase